MPEVEIKVGANTQTAEEAFRNLAKEASDAFRGLSEEGQKAAARLDALDKAWDSPARLGKAAALAKLELDGMAESLEKSGRLTPELSEKIDIAAKKIDLAAERSRKFSDVADDMRVSGETAAKGIEAVSQRTGDLNGVLELLKASGASGAETIETIAFSLVALNGALELGKKAMDGIQSAIKGATAAYNEHAQAQMEAKMRADLEAAALAAVAKGHIEAGKTAGETAERYKTYIENTQRAEITTNDFVKALDKVKSPDGWKKTTDDVGRLNAALALLASEGGKRFEDFAKENEGYLKELSERYRLHGEMLPEWVAKAVKANEDAARAEAAYQKRVEAGKTVMEDRLNQMSEIWQKQQEAIKAGEEVIRQSQEQNKTDGETSRALAEIAGKYGLTVQGLKDLIRENESYKRAMDEARERIGADSTAREENIEWIRRQAEAYKLLEKTTSAQRSAAVGMAQSADDMATAFRNAGMSSEDMARVMPGVIKNIKDGKDSVVSSTITWLQYTKATDAQIDSLEKLIGKFKEVDDAIGRNQASMLDYAANIKTAFESGFTSMFGVLGQLDEAIQQMMILKMRNAGTVFAEEIERMLTAYQQLRDAIATGQVKKSEQMKGMFI